jgi:hypothetical protein
VATFASWLPSRVLGSCALSASTAFSFLASFRIALVSASAAWLEADCGRGGDDAGSLARAVARCGALAAGIDGSLAPRDAATSLPLPPPSQVAVVGPSSIPKNAVAFRVVCAAIAADDTPYSSASCSTTTGSVHGSFPLLWKRLHRGSSGVMYLDPVCVSRTHVRTHGEFAVSMARSIHPGSELVDVLVTASGYLGHSDASLGQHTNKTKTKQNKTPTIRYHKSQAPKWQHRCGDGAGRAESARPPRRAAGAGFSGRVVALPRPPVVRPQSPPRTRAGQRPSRPRTPWAAASAPPTGGGAPKS